MKNNGRGGSPNLRPVTRIELSEKNVKLRWIAIVVLLVIAVVFIGRGVYAMLNVQPGWQAVEITSKIPNTSREFSLQYDFSESGGSASALLRQLQECYRKASEDAFLLFSAETEGEGNVHSLNAHINEAVTLDPRLYRALEEIEASAAPYFFLAPAMAEYDRVFLCGTDSEAALYDPAQNPETARWLSQLGAFVTDPAEIFLELLGSNQARLTVGEGYRAFAEKSGIESFFDFGWMKNAFIADFLAQALEEQGFTRGYLMSYDGFTRNLDTRGMDYAVNVFDRRGGDLYLPAMLHYNRPMSLVFLRDYPVGDRDQWHYYGYESGEIVTAFLDPADGMSKPAIPTLLSYSESLGCGEMVQKLLPVFIADTFDPAGLAIARMETVWCRDGVVYHTEENAGLELNPESGYRIA